MFNHSPLDLTKHSVRLLKLLPRGLWGQIRLSIRHASLQDGLSYSALSYEWGDPSSLHVSILIDEEVFRVRKNLFDFLSSFSEQTKDPQTLELWIDAICIDQGDVLEKNHQVQQMKSIYQRAERVIVWLGPARDGSDRLIDLLNSFPILRTSESTASSLRAVPTDQWRACHDILLGASAETLKAAALLAKRSYWHRMWIIQEIFLGNRIDICCGSKQTSWGAWIIAMDAMINYTVIQMWTGDPSNFRATAITQFWMAKLDRTLSSSENICTLVATFGSFECENIRDKVYALLGLASDSGNITVDYQCSIQELCRSLLMKWPKMELEQHRDQFSKIVDVFTSSGFSSLKFNITQPIDHHELLWERRTILILEPSYIFTCRCFCCCRFQCKQQSSRSLGYSLFKSLRKFWVIDFYVEVPGLNCRFYFCEMRDGTNIYIGTSDDLSALTPLIYYDETSAQAFESSDTKTVAIFPSMLRNLLLHEKLRYGPRGSQVSSEPFERVKTSPNSSARMRDTYLRGAKEKDWALLSDIIRSLSTLNHDAEARTADPSS